MRRWLGPHRDFLKCLIDVTTRSHGEERGCISKVVCGFAPFPPSEVSAAAGAAGPAATEGLTAALVGAGVVVGGTVGGLAAGGAIGGSSGNQKHKIVSPSE